MPMLIHFCTCLLPNALSLLLRHLAKRAWLQQQRQKRRHSLPANGMGHLQTFEQGVNTIDTVETTSQLSKYPGTQPRRLCLCAQSQHGVHSGSRKRACRAAVVSFSTKAHHSWQYCCRSCSGRWMYVPWSSSTICGATLRLPRSHLDSQPAGADSNSGP